MREQTEHERVVCVSVFFSVHKLRMMFSSNSYSSFFLVDDFETAHETETDWNIYIEREIVKEHVFTPERTTLHSKRRRKNRETVLLHTN